MGKLADLRDELDGVEPGSPRALELQKEINKIEEWCMKNNPDWGVKVTKWGNSGDFDDYPWNAGAVYFEDIWQVGVLNGEDLNYNTDKSIHA